jgi:hypothetical protein
MSKLEKKSREKKKGEEEKFYELGLYYFSPFSFFFNTYKYFQAAATYKTKRSLFINKFLENYVDPQQTHTFISHKPRLTKDNQSKR